MYAKIRPRRGTATEWALLNPVLVEGELAIEVPDNGVGTGLCKFKIGDGYKTWNELPYAFDANSAQSIYGGNVYVSRDICLRSGTTDEWEAENPVLKLSEVVVDISKGSIKIGDGEHAFVDLPYVGAVDTDDLDFDFGDLDEQSS